MPGLSGEHTLAADVLPSPLLQVLTDFLAHTPFDFLQLALPPLLVSPRQEAVAVVGIDVPKHGTAEVLNLKRLEQAVPPAHPVVVLGVEHDHAVPVVSGVCSRGYPAA